MSQASSQDNAALTLPQRTFMQAAIARVSDYVTLTKPGITVMIVITALLGYAMASHHVGWGWLSALAVLAGTGFSCMGAAAFNQAIERDTDRIMQRTRERPLPAGRVRLIEANIFAACLSALGLSVLFVLATPLAAALSAFTIFSYVLIYTPLKRIHASSTVVGAVPGAMPPVIGYAGLTGTLTIEPLLLFLIMALWQIPHFLAIGILYREQYERAGMPILPVIDPQGTRTHRHILIYCIGLLIAGILPTLLGIAGNFALVAALLCGGLFLAMAVRLIQTPSRERARGLFLASLVYLPVVLSVIVLNPR